MDNTTKNMTHSEYAFNNSTFSPFAECQVSKLYLPDSVPSFFVSFLSSSSLSEGIIRKTICLNMLKNFVFRRLGGEVVEVFHQNGTPPFYQLYLMRAKRKVSGKFPASRVPGFNASWFSLLGVHKSIVYEGFGQVGNV